MKAVGHLLQNVATFHPARVSPQKNRSTEETEESRFKLKTLDVNSGVPGQPAAMVETVQSM